MTMGELFKNYPMPAGDAPRLATKKAFDEMFGGPNQVRANYQQIYDALTEMTMTELTGRTEALASSYLAQGVTFDFAGEERPFPLDAVPRVIEAGEWKTIDAGVQQRVKVLEAFLADIYGPKGAIRDGVIPASLVTSSSHFHRAASGIDPANGVRIQVSGIDLVRDEAGAWRVLEDNVRVPSGVSYVHSAGRRLSQPPSGGAARCGTIGRCRTSRCGLNPGCL